MKIAENILDILAECRTEGNVLYLPEQLERNTYLAVNKCLDNIGGKWNRQAKGHIFDYDPAEALENLIATGETESMKKKFQFFPTPRPVAELMCDMAELTDDCIIFEPSCGKGDLADVIYGRAPEYLICNELNRDMQRYLDEKPYNVMYGDFLDCKPGELKPFDRIVMNPPFAKQQDIDHILHAYSLLKDGGILVSVLFPSWRFRSNKKSVEFRAWLADVGCEILEVPEGAFKESGTMFSTNIIKIKKR